MRRKILTLLVLFGLVAAITFVAGAASCPQPPNPDLYPVQGTGDFQFCDIEWVENTTMLMVHIYCEYAIAPVSEVEVIFDMGGGGAQPVRAEIGPFLSMNTTESVAIPIPLDCFNPDCSFTITADVNDVVEEFTEQNNEVQGMCIG